MGGDSDKARCVLPEVAGYTVERPLGEGGQAQVFLAHQQSTGQAVAIKVFRGQGISDSQCTRIQQETEALVRLQLPNVVPILDRCETACGQACLVTRFIPGRPLDEVTAEWREHDPQQVVDLFIKIALTLEKVHRAGIVHRDLKPSNVLVDESGEPHLLDFGLASFFADPGGRLLTATFPARFEGSLRWASPEQVDASFGRIDHRSDLYSLGVMLYEALSGRFPYATRGGILEVAQQIVRAQPLPLPHSDQDSAGIGADVSAIVQQLLEKRPARRFQSADELQQALGAARPTKVKTYKQSSRHRSKWIWTTGVFAVAVLSAAAWAAWQPAPSSPIDRPEQPASEVVAAGSLSAMPHVTSSKSPTQQLDTMLAPFGEVPDGWRQVGSLQHDHHAIERDDLTIQGNFRLRLDLVAARAEQAQVVITLVGQGAADDLKITASKTNTWSNNEMWYFHTPAGTTSANLPIGSHVLTIDRVGERVTLSADAVAGSGETRLATFAVDAGSSFQAVRIASSGPDLSLEGLRINPLDLR